MKSKHRSRFYFYLQKEVERELLDLLKKLKIYPQITPQQLKSAIYYCLPKNELNVFDPFLKKAKKINPNLTQQQLDNLNIFLHNQFWNISPIKFLGGKSPFQLTEEKIIQNPKQNLIYHPVFFELVLPFKIVVEEVITQIKDKNRRMNFRNSLPLLFKRYWYSPIIKGKGDSSPFLTFLNIINFYLPNISLYFFPFYEKNDLIFQSLPLENNKWNSFPIIFDLSTKGKSYFYSFGDYCLLVDKLKKMNFSLDFSFFSYFIDFLLLNWKDLDPIIKNLTDREWLGLWRKFLSQAAVDVVDTEGIIYSIIILLREKGIKVNFILQWMAQWPNIKKSDNPSREEDAQDFFFFKLITDFDRFFITPLTLALPVFHLIYAGKVDLEEEVKIFLSFNSEVVFYKTPTKLTFNEFGRQIFKRYYREDYTSHV